MTKQIKEQIEEIIKKNLPEKQDVSKAVKGSQHKFAILGHNKCLDEINTELIADEVLKVVVEKIKEEINRDISKISTYTSIDYTVYLHKNELLKLLDNLKK